MTPEIGLAMLVVVWFLVVLWAGLWCKGRDERVGIYVTGDAQADAEGLGDPNRRYP